LEDIYEIQYIAQGKKGEWIMEIKVEKPTRQFLNGD